MTRHLESRAARPWLLIGCAALCACGSDPAAPAAESTGELRFVTTTVGRNVDADGYAIVLNGAEGGTIGPLDTVTIDGLSPGQHSADLSGLAANCYRFFNAPILPTVLADVTIDVPFGVECLEVPGDVSLTFVRLRLDPSSVHIAGLRAPGGMPVDLTFSANDRAPDWSPSGSRLAFSRMGVLMIVNADGTGLQSFEGRGPGDGQGSNPAWSPDGTKIAFDYEGEVYVLEPDGTGAAVLLSAGIQPAWSPDGSKIAVEGEPGEIFVMNADGSNLLNLTQEPMLVDREPTWSPDGSRIAFRRLNRTETVGYDLWVMEADGTNQTRLVTLPGPQLQPRWLPDNRILFDSDGKIMALELDAGGALTTLTGEVGYLHSGVAWRSVP